MVSPAGRGRKGRGWVRNHRRRFELQNKLKRPGRLGVFRFARPNPAKQPFRIWLLPTRENLFLSL